MPKVLDDLRKILDEADVSTPKKQVELTLKLDAFYSAITATFAMEFAKGKAFNADEVSNWLEQFFIDLKEKDNDLFNQLRDVTKELNTLISKPDSRAGLALQKFGVCGSVNKIDSISNLAEAYSTESEKDAEQIAVKAKYVASMENPDVILAYQKTYDPGLTSATQGLVPEDERTGAPIPQNIDEYSTTLLLDWHQEGVKRLESVEKLEENILQCKKPEHREYLTRAGLLIKKQKSILLHEHRTELAGKCDKYVEIHKKQSILLELTILKDRYDSTFMGKKYNPEKALAVKQAIAEIETHGIDHPKTNQALLNMHEKVSKRQSFKLTSLYTKRTTKTGLSNLTLKGATSELSTHLAILKTQDAKAQLEGQKGGTNGPPEQNETMTKR